MFLFSVQVSISINSGHAHTYRGGLRAWLEGQLPRLRVDLRNILVFVHSAGGSMRQDQLLCKANTTQAEATDDTYLSHNVCMTHSHTDKDLHFTG